MSFIASGILSSCIATDQYQGTLITCTFSIVELDQDILQAMINCAAVALLSSSLKCRCLPVAICVLHVPTPNNIFVDPSLSELRGGMRKFRLVFNPDTEELIYSCMESRGSGSLTMENVEQIVGVGLAAAKKIQTWILQATD